MTRAPEGSFPDGTALPAPTGLIRGEHSISTSTILDTVPVGVAVLRAPDFEYELANPAFLELIGADGDPIGRPLVEAHPALVAPLASRVADVARSGEPLEVEDVPLPDGRADGPPRRWATFRLRALPEEPGRGRAVLVVANETTGYVVGRARAEALAAIAADMGEGGALADLLGRAAAKARELLGADGAFVLLGDADYPCFRGTVEVGGGARVEVTADAADLPAGALAMDRREPIVFGLDTAGGLEAAWLRKAGKASALCAPLPSVGRPLGLLYITWTTGPPVPPADVGFAAAVALACSLSVQRARTLRREREARLASHRATVRLELLAESGALLTGAVDWPAVVRTTAQLGLGYLADAAVLDLVAADGVLRREAMEHAGDPPPRSSLPPLHREEESPALRDALDTRRARRIVVPAGGVAVETGDPDLVTLDALGATSCIIAPLVIRGRAAGVLTLLRRAPSPPHEPEDVLLATEIARRAALAFDDARLLAAAADEAAGRDSFLAAAAHDLRSPLTALRLQVETLERSGSVAARGRTRVARLRSSLERLARRVEQVLDAARASPRGALLEREPLDLAALAREVVTRAMQERGRDAAAVRVVAPKPVPGRWDRLRVEGIVANLIAVAAKRGGERVEVRVRPEERGGRIEVHRPGVQDDAAAPHGQAAAEYEDLEVGVWIARRFAEAHGGRLTVVHLPRVGARFTVDLPG